MKYNIEVFSIFEYGKRVDSKGRPHQEDCLFPAHGEAKRTDRFFVLCDGMGGHDAGEVASATVCEAMGQWVLSARPDAEGAFERDDIQRALTAAFDALDKKDNGAVKKMGTTMTMLKLFAGGCYIAHMGDSRVYHIRPGKTAETTRILFRTEDHSLVNDLVRLGELTLEEARVSKQKNIITRAMQPNMDYRPKADIYHTADIEGGDYFYMCSDGMLEHMDDDNLRFIFSDEGGIVSKKVNTLTQGTRENSDNHSAIIVHILGVSGVAEPVTDGTESATIAPETSSETTACGPRNKLVMRSKAPQKQSARMIAARKEQNRRRWLAALSFVLIIAIVAVAAYLFLPNGSKSSEEQTQPQKGIILYDEPQQTPIKAVRDEPQQQNKGNDGAKQTATETATTPVATPEKTGSATKTTKEVAEQAAAAQSKKEAENAYKQQIATKITQKKDEGGSDAVDADAETAAKSEADRLKEYAEKVE